MCRWSGGTVVWQRSQRSRRHAAADGAGAAPSAWRGRAGRRPSAPCAGRPLPRRGSSQRDLDLLLLAQQRDRLELEVVVVHRAARLRQEVAAPAARAARARRSSSAPPSRVPPQSAQVLRYASSVPSTFATTSATPSHVGRDERLGRVDRERVPGRRAVHLHDRQRDAGDRGPRPPLPRRCPRRPCRRGPGRPPRAPGARPARASRTTPGTTCSCPRGAASRSRPRSPSSSTLPPCDSMYGRTRVERLRHALLDRHRVEVVDHQQPGDELVLGHLVAGPLVGQLDDALEAGAVHLHDRRGQLLGELTARPGRRGPRAAP